MAGDHMNLEEDHCLKYKTPIWVMNLNYRLSWLFMLYIVVYCNFLLGTPEKIFNMHDFDYKTQPTSEGESPVRYESIYQIDNRVRY